MRRERSSPLRLSIKTDLYIIPPPRVVKTRGGGFVFVGEDVRRIIRNSPTVVSKVNTGIDVDRQIMRRLSAPCSPLCSSKKRARSGLGKRSQSTRINSLQPASLETISKIICCKFHGALFDSKVTTNIRTLELTHFFGHYPSAPTASLRPHFNGQRARVTRASGVFRFLPSPLHHKAVKNYASTTCR